MGGGLSCDLAAGAVLHLPADVTHARRGALRHAFRYRVDYLLFAPERVQARGLFRLGRFGLFSFCAADHGGARGAGRGAAWAWEVLARAGLPRERDMTLALMTQPRFLGFWFNPVSFWMVLRGDALLAVIAEVNNTFGQRHSYLCHLPGFAPVGPADRLDADKVFHVSPFQDVAGRYEFRFSLNPADIGLGLTVFVMIRTRNHSADWLADFRREALAIPNIIDIYRIAGDYDYMLKVVAADMNDFDRVYQRLIEKISLETVTSLITMEAIADSRDLPL